MSVSLFFCLADFQNLHNFAPMDSVSLFLEDSFLFVRYCEETNDYFFKEINSEK